jgi:hypothetical protein
VKTALDLQHIGVVLCGWLDSCVVQMNEQLEFLAYIVERLEQLDIAYMVTG